MDDMLAVHVLTGCNTVATYVLVKSVALKTIRSATLPLSNVGDTTLSVEEALVQSAPIMLSCYGHPECSSLTDARQHIWLWSRKVLRKIGAVSSFRVCPLNEAVMENVVRAHMHVLSNMAMGQSTDTMIDQRRRIYISEVAEEILPCSTIVGIQITLSQILLLVGVLVLVPLDYLCYSCVDCIAFY